MKKQIGVIGNGNFGTAIANLITQNIHNKPEYNQTVYMWTYEETVDNQKLSEIINTTHENIKYLPGVVLHNNLLAVVDIKKVISESDLLILLVPHQFVKQILENNKNFVKKHVIVVSLIKGILFTDKLVFISELVQSIWNRPCNVLMGANIASEIAENKIAEGTLAINGTEHEKKIIYNVFNCFNYRIRVVDDVKGVELFGTLKNIVAIGYGICVGLNLSMNTSSAYLRAGLNEIIRFNTMFYPETKKETAFESAGIADLIVTCLSGRNSKCGVELAHGKTIEEIESKMFGQKLQGTISSKEIFEFLKNKNKNEEFPLFTCVYRICYESDPVDSILECISYFVNEE